MPDAQITVLDVGDGCCTVLRDEKGMVLFDFAGGPVPRDYFRAIEQEQIEAVFISHTHKDHCAGLTGQFGEDFPISVIFMNHARGRARTGIYRKVIKTITAAMEGPNPPRLVPFNPDIREECMERGEVSIQILAPRSTGPHEPPSPEWTNEHTSCGVARIDHGDRQCVLLPGDLNARGLKAIAETDPGSLKAEVLLFPHHGGNPGSVPRPFAEELVSLVKPDIVAFSQARNGNGHPRPDVIAGVRSAAPEAHVCCSQLSVDCDARDLHESAPRSDITLPAAGLQHPRGACCAGPIEIALGGGPARFLGDHHHRQFIELEVDESMCGQA